MNDYIRIDPKEFKHTSSLYKNIYIDKLDLKLIRGSVRQNNCIPIENAVVIVYIKLGCNNCYNSQIEELGYTITNENGEFAFTIDSSKFNCNCFEYILEVFNPLIPCRK